MKSKRHSHDQVIKKLSERDKLQNEGQLTLRLCTSSESQRPPGARRTSTAE